MPTSATEARSYTGGKLVWIWSMELIEGTSAVSSLDASWKTRSSPPTRPPSIQTLFSSKSLTKLITTTDASIYLHPKTGGPSKLPDMYKSLTSRSSRRRLYALFLLLFTFLPSAFLAEVALPPVFRRIWIDHQTFFLFSQLLETKCFWLILRCD
jgi:hypothetical protein